ncbi:MAG: hypothetical protein V3U94_02860 [Candidatus Thorarchaeota archaeon]
MSWIVSIEHEDSVRKTKSVRHAQYVNDMMDEVRKAAEKLVEPGAEADFIKVYLSEHPDV